jgi:hypothetical protein
VPPLYAYPVAVGLLDEHPLLLNVIVTLFLQIATIFVFALNVIFALFPASVFVAVDVVVVVLFVFFHPIIDQLLYVYAFDAGVVAVQLVPCAVPFHVASIVHDILLGLPVALLIFFCGYP